ncbi:beta-propeller fold lactonase family protein [Streptomyces sp. WAC06614]|uniref:beta-propeller fold lactonase family protein n=1 Tax=Streptomyces sp. WAC06614 TaxID=2487416 RepID=UPI00163C1ECC|nr:beta-propeller fold lactonase family protein [Streptomyces sp. WAC06614]
MPRSVMLARTIALAGGICLMAPAGASAMERGASPALPVGEYAFIVNSDIPHGARGSLAIVDTATDRTVKTVSEGLDENPESVAVWPDGSTAYVASFGDVTKAPAPQSVSVVDVAEGRVVARIPVGVRPEKIVLSPDGSRAYVVNSGALADPGGVSVIDTASRRVVDTLPVGANPNDMALTPDGRHAYVTVGAENTVAVLDTATGEVSARIRLDEAVAGLPLGVVVSGDGRRVYVGDNQNNLVHTIDTATNTLVGEPARLPGWGLAAGLGLTPDGRRLYVTEAASNEVAVLDTTTGQALPTTIRVGRNPTGAAVTPDGTKAYITSASDDSKGVSVIDTRTNTVIASLNPGSSPFGIVMYSSRAR